MCSPVFGPSSSSMNVFGVDKYGCSCSDWHCRREITKWCPLGDSEDPESVYSTQCSTRTTEICKYLEQREFNAENWLCRFWRDWEVKGCCGNLEISNGKNPLLPLLWRKTWRRWRPKPHQTCAEGTRDAARDVSWGREGGEVYPAAFSSCLLMYFHDFAFTGTWKLSL